MVCMTRNHFSKKGGPYFVGEPMSQHAENKGCTDLSCSSTMDKIKKFFNSRRKKEQAFFYTKPSCLPSNKEE